MPFCHNKLRQSQAENVKLRIEVNDIEAELDFTRKQLDSIESLNDGDLGRRENEMLQKKLGEVEEELKILNNLQADNERLKDENRALIRVVSKLSK